MNKINKFKQRKHTPPDLGKFTNFISFKFLTLSSSAKELYNFSFPMTNTTVGENNSTISKRILYPSPSIHPHVLTIIPEAAATKKLG